MPPPPARSRRLLLINPNTTVAVTDRLQHLARLQLGVGTVVQAVTAPFGSSYIASEAACAVAGHATLQAWQLARARAGEAPPEMTGWDAILIACFGDPGLFALREQAGERVTGLAEASFIEASAKGRYGVVTGGRPWAAMLERLALALPAGAGLVDIETVELDGAALMADPARGQALLREACERLLARTPVESLIIGGAGLAGFAARLQPTLPLPLIDSVEAGLRQVWLVPHGKGAAKG